jgi:hypothetical protein
VIEIVGAVSSVGVAVAVAVGVSVVVGVAVAVGVLVAVEVGVAVAVGVAVGVASTLTLQLVISQMSLLASRTPNTSLNSNVVELLPVAIDTLTSKGATPV